tara:strand:+ start:2260 stop:2568 length:309 start_codon:yes stop_codon:yes gene_type:complete
MTKDIDKLAEEIFEAEDDLPHTLTTRSRIWLGQIRWLDGHVRIVAGFSHDDLLRKASFVNARLIYYDYYDGGIQAILEDSVDDLWQYAYERAEAQVDSEVVQ